MVAKLDEKVHKCLHLHCTHHDALDENLQHECVLFAVAADAAGIGGSAPDGTAVVVDDSTVEGTDGSLPEKLPVETDECYQ